MGPASCVRNLGELFDRHGTVDAQIACVSDTFLSSATTTLCRSTSTTRPRRHTQTSFRSRGFWTTVCKTVRPMLSDRCLSCQSVLSVCPVSLSICIIFIHCGQTVGWIKMKLGKQVGRGPGHIVLHWDPAPPPPKWGRALTPNFRPIYVAAKWLDGSRCHLIWR